MSSDVISIVLTGRGGQGVKLATELLAWSAGARGFRVVQYSVYGGLIRGGEIASTLAASPDDPGVPLRSNYSIMCALNTDWFERYYPLLDAGGLLAYDEDRCSGLAFDNPLVHHVPVPFNKLAADAGDGRSSNMVAAGVVARFSSVASTEHIRQGMTAVVPAHRADRIDKNMAAVELGFAWASEAAASMPATFSASVIA